MIKLANVVANAVPSPGAAAGWRLLATLRAALPSPRTSASCSPCATLGWPRSSCNTRLRAPCREHRAASIVLIRVFSSSHGQKEGCILIPPAEPLGAFPAVWSVRRRLVPARPVPTLPRGSASRRRGGPGAALPSVRPRGSLPVGPWRQLESRRQDGGESHSHGMHRRVHDTYETR